MENSTAVKLVMGQSTNVVLPRKCTRPKKPQISVNGVPVYQFLDDETIVGVKLNDNEKLLLSLLIRHYTRRETKDEPFVGGIRRTQRFLNVSKPTAIKVLKHLLQSGLIYRNSMCDAAFGVKVFTCGIGVNQYIPTVYFVKNELLMLAAPQQFVSCKLRCEK